MSRLSHVNDAGQASMVDVSAKPETARTAVAEGSVRMLPATLRAILENSAVKGDVLAVARVAGIQGAKRCADLIPLCHPLPLSRVSVDFAASGDTHLEIRAECRVTGRTGVEMEALTAVSVAALTVYDMCKAVDRGMVIEQIRLCSKEGGKSGPWRRGQPEENTESVAGTAESVAKDAESVAKNAGSVAKTTKDGGGPVP